MPAHEEFLLKEKYSGRVKDDAIDVRRVYKQSWVNEAERVKNNLINKKKERENQISR